MKGKQHLKALDTVYYLGADGAWHPRALTSHLIHKGCPHYILQGIEEPIPAQFILAESDYLDLVRWERIAAYTKEVKP